MSVNIPYYYYYYYYYIKAKQNQEGTHYVVRSPVSKQSMHIYILTYYRLRNKRRLIALGSH